MQPPTTPIFSQDLQPTGLEWGGSEFLFMERSRFRARSTRVALRKLWLIYAEADLPMVAYAKVPADMLMFAVSAKNSGSPIWGGVRVDPRDIITIGSFQSLHLRTEGACRLTVICVQASEFKRYGLAVVGKPIDLPASIGRYRASPDAIKTLRELHSSAMRAFRAHAGRVASAEAAHGLQQQLIHALVLCVSREATPLFTTSGRRAYDVMTQFEEAVSRNTGHLRVTQLCSMLQVSEGVLRRCCKEFLGTAPSTYVRLHRDQ